LNADLYDKIAKRRAKAQRPLLLKFLQEVGYEDIFSTDEVNEIKNVYEKAQTELSKSLAETENINEQNRYAHMLQEKIISSTPPT